jgi:hypothetical protein
MQTMRLLTILHTKTTFSPSIGIIVTAALEKPPHVQSS